MSPLRPMGLRRDVITFGRGLPDESELHLCGDLGPGTRSLELGISNGYNSLAMAKSGSKAIAVDPDPERIDSLRRAATEHELRVECHLAELADLGFATSGSIDLVVADRTIDDFDDLGRLLRQVHRVLVPDRLFVIIMRHPFAPLASALARREQPEPYGSSHRSIGEWFTALSRANFDIDTMLELDADDHAVVPSTLIVRARKRGS